jgi:hypothetical protein
VKETGREDSLHRHAYYLTFSILAGASGESKKEWNWACSLVAFAFAESKVDVQAPACAKDFAQALVCAKASAQEQVCTKAQAQAQLCTKATAHKRAVVQSCQAQVCTKETAHMVLQIEQQ